MWRQWLSKHSAKVLLTFLTLSCCINVAGESQNAEEQSSNWLWSWVYFTFIKAAITFTLYVMLDVMIRCLSNKKDVND